MNKLMKLWKGKAKKPQYMMRASEHEPLDAQDMYKILLEVKVKNIKYKKNKK